MCYAADVLTNALIYFAFVPLQIEIYFHHKPTTTLEVCPQTGKPGTALAVILMTKAVLQCGVACKKSQKLYLSLKMQTKS